MNTLRVAVLGAGGRGYGAYGGFALSNPHLLKYVAVAEPDDARRDRLADAHGIPEEFRYRTWQKLIEKRPPADAVFNCLQDAPFFQTMKQTLGREDLGEIVTVEHKENVAFWRHAHSFARGSRER